MTERPEPLLWLDDHRGVYLPRDFAICFPDRGKAVQGVSESDFEILEEGPNHELYYETWDVVLADAIVTDNAGVKYFLHQDGALWLVPVGMAWDDMHGGYVWPDPEESGAPNGWDHVEGGARDSDVA